MTRIAAGEPAIWPDVCVENRTGILDVLDRLLDALGEVRRIVADGDREMLLEDARAGPGSPGQPSGRGPRRARTTAEVRVPVLDRPGVLAEVTTLLGEMGVNIYDLEIAHSAEGDRGVLVLVVDCGCHRAGPRRPARRGTSAARSAPSARDRVHRPAGPPGGLRGRLRVPGDKSISHRALLLAARAEGGPS